MTLVLTYSKLSTIFRYSKLFDHHYPAASKNCLNASIHSLKALESYGVGPSWVVLCEELMEAELVAIVTQTLINISNLYWIRYSIIFTSSLIWTQVLIASLVYTIHFYLLSYHQKQNISFLTRDIIVSPMCENRPIDLSWRDTMLKGTGIPSNIWKMFGEWLDSDNMPQCSEVTPTPELPGPINEAACLETKHVSNAESSPFLEDDKTITQLSEVFLENCQFDTFGDNPLLLQEVDRRPGCSCGRVPCE